jgi:hypothetical protein
MREASLAPLCSASVFSLVLRRVHDGRDRHVGTTLLRLPRFVVGGTRTRVQTHPCVGVLTRPPRDISPPLSHTHTRSVHTEMRGQRHNHAPSGPGVRWAAEPAANPKSDVTVCRDRPVVVKINRGPNQAPSTTAAARRRLIEDQFRQASILHNSRLLPFPCSTTHTHPDLLCTLSASHQPFFGFSVVCLLHSIPL